MSQLDCGIFSTLKQRFVINERCFFRVVFFSKSQYCIPTSTKLNSGDGIWHSTLENSRTPIPKRIAHDSIVFYEVLNSKKNFELLSINVLNKPCTAVIENKRTVTPSFSTLLISVLLFGSYNLTFFKIRYVINKSLKNMWFFFI